MSGAKEDLTKDMPNPPQPLKVEEVTKQLSQQTNADSGGSPVAVAMEGRCYEDRCSNIVMVSQLLQTQGVLWS